MNIRFQIWLSLITTIFLLDCSHNSGMKKNVQKNVDIDLVLPRFDFEARTLHLGCFDNLISVIIRNNSDSTINIYDDDQSWGYYNFYFIIKTMDSSYTILKKYNGSLQSSPALCYELDAGESLVFNYNLVANACYSNSEKLGFKGDSLGWTGLPHKAYDSALLKVMYELKDIHDSSFLNTIPKKLESKFYKVKIINDDFPPFKEVLKGK